jgi:2',3'-cyclic-nucleotide 2'-phosphodiesterase
LDTSTSTLFSAKPDGAFRCVMLGDVVGSPGREGIAKVLPGLKLEQRIDCAVVNAENASGGVGLVPQSAEELLSHGADILTLGDHGLQRKELFPFLERHADKVIRPLNYPDGAPGKGWAKIRHAGQDIVVVNLMGRVFMNNPLDCQFKAIDTLLAREDTAQSLVLVDHHAEATSEKIAMGRYLDGRVSAVVGTHTHVQTADYSVLANGTAYITDLGMTGSADGVIGMDAKVAIKRLTTGLHAAYKLSQTGNVLVCGVMIDFDPSTKRALQIQLVRLPA